MSILNVNKINPVGGGSTITIAGIASVTGNVTAPNFVGAVTGNVTGNADTASGLSGNPSINTTGIVTATSFVPTVGQLSHRNIIVNGSMIVAQRGSSSTANGYGSVDRFQCQHAGVDESPTHSQHTLTSSDTGPYAEGFRKSFHVQNGNQTSGAGTGDWMRIWHKIEAQDLANSGWNYTSSSSYITLSFWVKVSVTQTYYVQMRTSDGTSKSYYFAMNLSANTWTKVTHSIPGHADISFDNDNGEGIYIAWYGYRGTANTGSGQNANVWYTFDGATLTPDQTSTWWTTNDSTFEITGVQLEVGSVTTPFEHRSFGDELARCQRYFYRHGDLNTTRSYALMGNGMIGHNGSTDTGKIEIVAPVRMRQQPTVSVIGTDSFIISTGGAETGTSDAIGTLASGGLWTSASSDINFWVDFGRTSGGSPNRGVACIVYANNNGANLGFSAEL